MSTEVGGSLGPNSVLVSLGSNIEPELNLRAAVKQLSAELSVEAVSRVFVTRAVAASPMSDFFNAALEIRTCCSAAELKYGVFRDLEWRLGRRRTADRDAPRPIDLDVAIYGAEIVESEPLGLAIPDPEILTHLHVAVPLADLAPERLHPVTGEPLSAIVARLEATAPPGKVRPAPRSGFLRDFLKSA